MNNQFQRALPTLLFGACLLILSLTAASAQQQPENQPKRHSGFTGRLASPEILVGLREKLELTNKQTDRIEWLFNKIKPDLDAAQREHKKRDAAFHGYLENKEIDPDEAAQYLARLNKADADAKLLYITALIDVDNILPAEQRTKLNELRQNGEIVGMIERGKDFQKRLQAKLKKYQENMRVFADLGGPPNDIAEISEKIQTAMADKNYVEVEKLLDKALAAMELK